MPKVLPFINVNAIPSELRELPRWACWQEMPTTDGKKPGKPPLRANIKFSGRHVYAKANDPSTWASFAQALGFWQQHLRGKEPASGLSFALNGDGIIGIDLDGCRANSVIEDWAVKIIKRFASYTELSPSRTGIRIFLRGELPAHGRKNGAIEVYDAKKFLSVTGRKLASHGAGDGVEDREAELLAWHREVFGDGAATSTKGKAGRSQLIVSDSPSINKARLESLFRAKPKAREIFEGRHKKASQSEADMALANYATSAGWTAQQTCDLLVLARQNACEPIKHDGYFERTIAKAREACNAGRIESKLQSLLTKRARPGTDEVTIGGSHSEDTPEAASMADVAKLIEGVRYLVPDWIPFGMVTMLMGEPGAGKSAFALYALGRPIITPCDWFSGAKGPKKPGNVLWCDCEGTAAITVQRIKDWNLPAEWIKVLFQDDPLLSVNLAFEEHLERIEAVIGKHQIQLVVIDSLRGAHDGDENNSRVVGVLQGLSKIAERTGAAVVIIHHARKLAADEEVTANASRGSNAIVGMVRSQLGIDRPDPQRKDWNRLRMLKENLGLKPKPVGFRVTNKGLEFGEAPERPRKESIKDRAEAFLLANMKPGQWYAAAELIADAEQEGLKDDVLNRARTDLGIVKPDFLRKDKNGWHWMLPILGGK